MVIRNRRAWEPQGDNGVCVCVCVQGLRAYLKEWLFVYVPGCKSVCMCVPMHGGGILACLPRVNHRRVRDTLALARWSWAAVGPAGVREAAAAGLALACSETSDALGAPSPVSRRTDPLERAYNVLEEPNRYEHPIDALWARRP